VTRYVNEMLLSINLIQVSTKFKVSYKPVTISGLTELNAISPDRNMNCDGV
jgi:hypothetical protein